jgi:hypothetical protein
MLTPGKGIFHPNFSGKKKGLKNPGPCEDPWPSAPRGGHAGGMVGTEGWSKCPVEQRDYKKKGKEKQGRDFVM